MAIEPLETILPENTSDLELTREDLANPEYFEVGSSMDLENVLNALDSMRDHVEKTLDFTSDLIAVDYVRNEIRDSVFNALGQIDGLKNLVMLVNEDLIQAQEEGED